MSVRSKKNPLVSVIIPMYNAVSTIADCLHSVLQQTYASYEIIVVDDGSTDKSVSVVKNIIAKAKDKKITLVRKKNGGVSSARNAGMRKARGEFIALLDSDDEWLRGKLAAQMMIFEKNPTVDFVGCGRNNEGVSFLFKKVKGLTKVSVRDLIFKMNPQSSTAVFRKRTADAVGFYDESMHCAEDGDYWIRICAQHQFCVTGDNLVITGKGKPNFGHSGLSAKLWKMEKGELRNTVRALQRGYIGFHIFIAAIVFSLVKFARRIALVQMRKIIGAKHVI
jgi:glycosyltransferase involved in cell wall biosynthesis